MSVFGFSTSASTSGADFLPIVKFDARAGRVFRMDRENDGSGWITNQVDITKNFKAVIDFENLETGWIDFNTGGAPVFAMVPLGSPLPAQPTPNAKNGVRVMLKLAKEVGGEKPIRELASTAKAFLAGIEEVFLAYKADAAQNAGKLPVVVLEDTMPIKSGQGDKQSTNYQPQFKITGWVARGDLQPQARGLASMTTPVAPPSTGSTQVAPPAAKAAVTEGEDDFG